MRRIKLEIAYDGTKYCGWQVQPNGLAVEEVINKTLSDMLKEEIIIIGASRTDSGVHALGNVAVFDTESRIPGDKFAFAINQRLPDEIQIQSSCEVPLDFHPRRCKSSKTYRYTILNRKINIPSLRLYTDFVYIPLDIEAMQVAASYMVGEKDFKSFCSNKTNAIDTVRTVYSVDISKENDLISINIKGNGFLYNMVRIMVGTLIKVGMHVYPPEYVEEIINAKDRMKSGPKAPARGLTLVGINY